MVALGASWRFGPYEMCALWEGRAVGLPRSEHPTDVGGTMNDTIRLRDHSPPCEHKQAFQEHPEGPWECRHGINGCPGGKEITLTKVVAIFLQLPSGTEQEISLHSSSARMWVEVEEK